MSETTQITETKDKSLGTQHAETVREVMQDASKLVDDVTSYFTDFWNTLTK